MGKQGALNVGNDHFQLEKAGERQVNIVDSDFYVFGRY
jgi:hypothetical protein